MCTEMVKTQYESMNKPILHHSQTFFIADANFKAFTLKQISTFTHENDGIIIHTNKIITINSKTVTIHTQTGAVLASITSSLSEGEPIGMDVTSKFLTIFTMEGFLKIFDVSEPQPKPLTPTKAVHELIGDFGEVIQAKTNASGNKIALTIAAANLVPDGKLYVYDMDNNEMFIQNFRHNEQGNDSVESELEQDDAHGDMRTDKNDICRNRIPINFFWDRNDSRLLICDARKLRSVEAKSKYLTRSKSIAGKYTLIGHSKLG